MPTVLFIVHNMLNIRNRDKSVHSIWKTILHRTGN